MPVPSTAQGNLGRNALRGFGATQWDITLRRQFRFTERVSVQFRGDFFNIPNHPNFGSPINCLSSPQFGQATQMLNNYLGSGGQSGGFNPLSRLQFSAFSNQRLTTATFAYPITAFDGFVTAR